MTFVAGTHLLGSVSGYRTLACSSDVGRGEQDQLSVLTYGQTDDPTVLAGFDRRPLAFGRPLASGRFAVTRCFAGGSDDANRPTLRFLTLIFSRFDYQAIARAGLESLVENESIWRSEAFHSGQPISVPVPKTGSQSRPDQLDLFTFDCWIQALASGGAMAALPNEAAMCARILRLPSLLADEDVHRFSWGIRLLSPDTPVDLATLDRGASRTTRRRLIHRSNTSELHDRAVVFLSANLSRGELRRFPSVAEIAEQARESSASVAAQGRRVPGKRTFLRRAALFGFPLFAATTVSLVILAIARERDEQAFEAETVALAPIQTVSPDFLPAATEAEVVKNEDEKKAPPDASNGGAPEQGDANDPGNSQPGQQSAPPSPSDNLSPVVENKPPEPKPDPPSVPPAPSTTEADLIQIVGSGFELSGAPETWLDKLREFSTALSKLRKRHEQTKPSPPIDQDKQTIDEHSGLSSLFEHRIHPIRLEVDNAWSNIDKEIKDKGLLLTEPLNKTEELELKIENNKLFQKMLEELIKIIQELQGINVITPMESTARNEFERSKKTIDKIKLPIQQHKKKLEDNLPALENRLKNLLQKASSQQPDPGTLGGTGSS